MKQEKYTYDDWWEGRVCLLSSSTVCKAEDIEKIKRVAWNQFSKKNAAARQKKQLELFTKQYQETSKLYETRFLEEYNASQLKGLLLADEIEQMRIFFTHICPSDDMVRLPGHRNWIFENFDRSKMEQYIDRHLKKGVPVSPVFMHSPNFKFKKEICFEVTVASMWHYANWLEEFEQKHYEANKVDHTGYKPQIHENPYPETFKSKVAFELFETLKKNTVNKESRFSDYGHIFYHMKDRLRCIHAQVTQPAFIDFLNEKYSAELEDTKFKCKSLPKNKAAAFATATQVYNDSLSEVTTKNPELELK